MSDSSDVHRTLKNGDTGPDVKILQRELNQRASKRGLGHVDQDGEYGPKTNALANDVVWALGAAKKFIDLPGFGPGLQRMVRHPGKRTPAQRARALKRRKPTIVTAGQLGLNYQNLFGYKGTPTRGAGHYTAGHRARDKADLVAEMKADHAYHLSIGFGGLAYEAMFADDGTIGLGNPMWRKGAAVAGQNSNMTNLCHPGTTGDRITPAAVRSMRWYLANAHTSKVPKAHRSPVDLRKLGAWLGHKEFPGQSTACPGAMLPDYHERVFPR